MHPVVFIAIDSCVVDWLFICEPSDGKYKEFGWGSSSLPDGPDGQLSLRSCTKRQNETWLTHWGDYQLFVFRCPPQETLHHTSIVPMAGAATIASHGLKTISSTSSTFLPTGPGKIGEQWVNTCFQRGQRCNGFNFRMSELRTRRSQQTFANVIYLSWVRVLLTLAIFVQLHLNSHCHTFVTVGEMRALYIPENGCCAFTSGHIRFYYTMYTVCVCI